MRIVIITGSELRHRFFAKKMHISTTLLHVYFEKKANIHEKLDCTPIQRDIIDFHFAQREKKEQQPITSLCNSGILFLLLGYSNFNHNIIVLNNKVQFEYIYNLNFKVPE